MRPSNPQVVSSHLHLFFDSRRHHRHRTAASSLVSAIKSCTTHSSLPQAQQLHSLILKSGLDSNTFIHNTLINLYVKCRAITTALSMFESSSTLDTASCNILLGGYVKLRRMEDARKLFEEIPQRDCVSFTTMIMGLTENDRWSEALVIFKEMKAAGVSPNEVTLGTLISGCPRLGTGTMLHAVVIRAGLGTFVLVSTNLIHMYCTSSRLSCAEIIFNEVLDRNEVTWNVMLNGYAKRGRVDSARELFDKIPRKDLVAWSTMIDGYIRVDMLDEAVDLYRKMVSVGLKPNEVLIVDLVSACGRDRAVDIGRQLHCMAVKSGIDCYVYMQATIIHFYAACSMMDLACSQFEFGCKDNVSSWNALVGGFTRNKMVDSAREVFNMMPEKDVVSWSSMIAGYAQIGQSDSTLQLFREMLASGVQPNEITLVSVLSSIASSGSLNQGKWLHDYINDNAIPLNDNLSAGLIDMYAKCGYINKAIEVFYGVQHRVTSVSPWNAIIYGLAAHGHAVMSLRVFSDLQRTNMKPNSITFIGVLSACCHGGLLEQGEWYFNCMKRVYGIEPNVKHYGCMVDLLGRSGKLAEAESLIMRMPMEADVVIWGTLLAASRTHGNVEIGERAAHNLAQLQPEHGAGRVLLSNIYADAGKWDDVFVTRRLMQSQRVKKFPGCSEVT